MPVTPGAGPGAAPATKLQIGVAMGGLALLATAIFVFLIALWPYPTPGLVPVPEADGDTASASAAADSAVPPADTAAGDTAAGGESPPPTTTPASAAAAAGADSRTVPYYLWCDTIAQRYWKEDTPAAAVPKCVSVLGWDFALWDEHRLLLIVLLSGMLGAVLRSIRSIGWYVGNRALVRSWLPSYFLYPFTGALLAFVFYVVVRGGFFSPASSVEQTSPFGFAAFAALVGLFSEQAVLKLKQVAETIFSQPGPGAEAVPQETDASGADASAVPVIARAERVASEPGGPIDSVQIVGTGFVPGSTTVEVNGSLAPATVKDDKTILLRLPPSQVETPRPFKLAVVNPGGQRAETTVE